MLRFARYAIIKQYGGFFTKKFKGNVHLIMLPPPKEFAVYNMLGTLENGREALLLILRTADANELSVLDSFNNTQDGFKIVEELQCLTKESGAGSYKVALKKRGKFMQGNMDIRYEPEYSSGDTRIYSVAGKFALTFDEEGLTPTQVKMVAQGAAAALKSKLNMKKLGKMAGK